MSKITISAVYLKKAEKWNQIFSFPELTEIKKLLDQKMTKNKNNSLSAAELFSFVFEKIKETDYRVLGDFSNPDSFIYYLMDKVEYQSLLNILQEHQNLIKTNEDRHLVSIYDTAVKINFMEKNFE